MKKTITFVALMLGFALAAFSETRPEWISSHVKYGRETYEGKSLSDETKWTYAVGVSNLAASERRSRLKAEEALQESVATNVAGELTKNLDRTVFSEYVDDDSIPEEALVRYEEALNLAVRVKVPKMEFLEYYTEIDTESGKKAFKTFVLARYLTKELRDYVEKIDVEKAVKSATKKFEEKEGIDIPEKMEVLVVAKMEEEKVEYMEELPDVSYVYEDLEKGKIE